ncbi:Uncharacterised protein [Mycobacteroides abscessus subsp. abscessus]|nr:Uncharacterised protein [Mycobacteroides abscessus subsp. abscessus]
MAARALARASSAAVSRAPALAHSPVGRPVPVKYSAYSASMRSTRSGSLPDSATDCPAARSSARVSASLEDRSSTPAPADCKTRCAFHRFMSMDWSSMSRTR